MKHEIYWSAMFSPAQQHNASSVRETCGRGTNYDQGFKIRTRWKSGEKFLNLRGVKKKSQIKKCARIKRARAGKQEETVFGFNHCLILHLPSGFTQCLKPHLNKHRADRERDSEEEERKRGKKRGGKSAEMAVTRVQSKKKRDKR